MRLRMLTRLSGADLLLKRGDEHSFDAAEGKRLVDAGFAEPVDARPVERAVATPAAERRSARPPKKA